MPKRNTLNLDGMFDGHWHDRGWKLRFRGMMLDDVESRFTRALPFRATLAGVDMIAAGKGDVDKWGKRWEGGGLEMVSL